MDGYAVRAADTYGASSALPAYLTMVGEVRMGQLADMHLMSGQAILIHTGAMLPAGADSVVMVERTQRISDQEIEVLAPVAPGENVLQIGEDVRAGNPALCCGHRLRPQDIGGLLACGIREVQVAAPLRVAVMSSGDELVPALEEPETAQIRDINLPMLSAFCRQMGADVLALGIAPDHLDAQVAMASAGLAAADVLIMSAGSSVSVRDLTTSVINQLGEPGVLVHGLAVKPGKPTILACCGGKPVIGLPGNPVSALLVARQILPPLFAHLSGASLPPKTSLRGILTQNIPSVNGREDTVPVSIQFDADTCHVHPIAGKSNLIFTLLQADGVIEIPLNAGGLYAGTEVEVMLF
jgi:molybdopterin molybdotransferase